MRLYESKYLTIDVPASVERAWNVAQAANKPLVVITGDRLFLKFLDHEKNPHRFVEKPCPCGFFGSQAKKCVCSVKIIEKHQADLREKYQDCIWIEGWVGKNSIKFQNLDGSCLCLLKQAIQELSLTCAQTITLLEIADAIAKQNGQIIKPEYVAEAISYRSQ